MDEQELGTDFIFLKFKERNLSPSKGLTLLIEALAMALVGCSEREDLDKNIKVTQAALQEGALLYYEMTKHVRELLNEIKDGKTE